MELGGNIELTGFSELESSELFVVKKIVGQYAKSLAESHDGFTRLAVDSEHKGKDFVVTVSAQVSEGELKAKEKDTNLYFALTAALESVA